MLFLSRMCGWGRGEGWRERIWRVVEVFQNFYSIFFLILVGFGLN